MNVKLIHWTGTLKPMYIAARNCYSEGIPDTDLTEEAMAKWLQDKVVGRGHTSLLEHADFHFAIEGVSRVLTHQLVRHRLATYAQQSQRYVSMENTDFVVPPSFNAEETAGFLKSCEHALLDYMRFTNKLVKRGIPEKQAQDDARYLLPGACSSNIIMKVNGAMLIHQGHKRLCLRAGWEIRLLFREIYNLVPPLFQANMLPDCMICTEHDTCPMRQFSCRNYPDTHCDICVSDCTKEKLVG